jgi:hypothetical protein
MNTPRIGNDANGRWYGSLFFITPDSVLIVAELNIQNDYIDHSL